jgi:hypothetical protein
VQQPQLPVAINGGAVWVVSDYVYFAGGSTSATSFAATQAAYSAPLYRTPSISVPLRSGSLTSGTYHIVITPVEAADAVNTVQITLSGLAPGVDYPTTANVAIGELGWSPLSSPQSWMPVSVYTQGTSTRPVHIVLDTQAGAGALGPGQPLAWSWTVFNFYGQPVQIAESALPLINLLTPNQAIMIGDEDESDSWTPNNATVTIAQLE